MNSKRFCLNIGIVCMAIFLVGGGMTAYIDPFFHYHKPLKGWAYNISYNEERCVNPGIIKNFDYNAVIIGSSMVENFKVSEFNDLFHVNGIKIPFRSGSYKELDMNLRECIETEENLELVIRCVDYTYLMQDKDTCTVGIEYPKYITDTNIVNECEYLLNKNVLIKHVIGTVANTLSGAKEFDFDDYCEWDSISAYGEEQVLKNIFQLPKYGNELDLDRRNIVEENLEQNLLSTIRNNPQIEFYLYFPPYSIIYWEQVYKAGELNTHKDMEKMVIEALLNLNNVHLFSFNCNYKMICDLNNYRDNEHYSGNINSQMLIWMKRGIGELTLENYEQYLEECYEFYRESAYCDTQEGNTDLVYISN